MAFVFAGRGMLRIVLARRYGDGRGVERVLSDGGGELAGAVVDRINSHSELGFRIVGYLQSGEESRLPPLPCLGRVDEVDRVVREHEIEHVFVALPHASSEAMTALLDRLVQSLVSIHVVPDLLQFMVLRSRVEDIDGLPTINLTETPLEGWSRFVKRGFDLLVALAALLLFSPPRL